MSDTKSIAFLSVLSQLEDRLRAGIGSLEKNELDQLIKNINKNLHETVNKNIFKKAPDISHNWDIILEAVIFNHLEN